MSRIIYLIGDFLEGKIVPTITANSNYGTIIQLETEQKLVYTCHQKMSIWDSSKTFVVQKLNQHSIGSIKIQMPQLFKNNNGNSKRPVQIT